MLPRASVAPSVKSGSCRGRGLMLIPVGQFFGQVAWTATSWVGDLEALPGAPAAPAEIMRLPAQRDAPAAGASGRQPAHSEPSGDSCGSPAVGGHLSQDLVGRLEGCRQLARCCQDQPSPQVFKPFCSFAISFLLPRFGAVNFFFFSHQLPCFGSWQTKLVSPLI